MRRTVPLVISVVLLIAGVLACTGEASTVTPSIIPPTPTSTVTTSTPDLAGVVTGTVEIEGGRCCAGGVAGAPIDLSVALSATSDAGAVTEMRTVMRAGGCAQEVDMTDAAWEPFATERSYTFAPPLNWVGVYVSAQFRDEVGNLSPIICDDISVEGMPPSPPS